MHQQGNSIEKVKKTGFRPLIILSIGILITVFFVPMFDVWGGIFPSGVDYNFIYVISKLFEGTDFREWVEIFSWSACIPAVVLLVSSIVKRKVLSVLSSAGGAGFLLYNLFYYIAQNELSDVFDFDDCSISVGFWLALFLFIISFFYAILIKKNISGSGAYPQHRAQQENRPPSVSDRTTTDVAPASVQKAPSSQNAAANADNRDISMLEAYIQQASEDDPNLTSIMVMAGDAYYQGLYNAPKDTEKAMHYFKMAGERKDGYANYMLGGYYLFDDRAQKEFDSDAHLNLGIGLMYLSKSHLVGFQPATDLLNNIIKDGSINGARCIDDLLEIGGKENLRNLGYNV